MTGRAVRAMTTHAHATSTTAPFDRLTATLERVRPMTPRQGQTRAVLASGTCHGGRSGSLSVAETSAGNVIVHCFTGCNTEKIVAALGLTLRDLFVPSNPAELRRREDDRKAMRRRYARDPKGTRDTLLHSALDRRRDELEQQRGYAGVPLLTGDLEAARRHVARIVDEPEPKPLALEPWEIPLPHVVDPLWPLLHARAVEIAALQRWHRAKADAVKRWPDAAGMWAHLDADPHGPQRADYDRAESVAVSLLHPRRIERGLVSRSYCDGCGLFHQRGSAHHSRPNKP